MNGEKKYPPDTLRWHPAFMQAIQLELFDWKDSLEFQAEYQLTAEPLRIDLVIIKKKKNVFIDKNIARFFRTCNTLEYRSSNRKNYPQGKTSGLPRCATT